MSRRRLQTDRCVDARTAQLSHGEESFDHLRLIVLLSAELRLDGRRDVQPRRRRDRDDLEADSLNLQIGRGDLISLSASCDEHAGESQDDEPPQESQCGGADVGWLI